MSFVRACVGIDEELWSLFLSFKFFKRRNYRVYFYSLTSWQDVVKGLCNVKMIDNIMKPVEKVLVLEKDIRHRT